MEQEKYYTPTIEEIRIGYECEVLPINKSMDWEKAILRYNQGHEGHGIYNLYPFWWCYRKGETHTPILIQIINLTHIRTPYLTHEQIESEGFKTEFCDILVPHIKRYQKNDFTILYNFKKKELRIVKIDHNRSPSYIHRYEGSCPSINEFRQLFNLIK